LTLARGGRRPIGIVAGGTLACAAAIGCSSGSGGGASAAALPPNDKAAIERIFRPALARLGVRLTRGALIDLETAKPSATGTHLAVYVEPTGEFCQEPVPATDARPEPPPVTKIELTKSASRTVQWKKLDLARLLRDADRMGTRALSVYAMPAVRLTGFYEDATVKAKANASDTTTPAPTSPSYR
jgi:hypothetical protein